MPRGKNPNSQANLRKGGGRPKGTPNKATTEEREFARRIVTDRAYQQTLETRAKEGKLAPAVECMLWDRAYGKVREHVEVTGENGGPITVIFGGRHKPKAEDE